MTTDDRPCEHCGEPLPASAYADTRFCGRMECANDLRTAKAKRDPWSFASKFGVPPGYGDGYKSARLSQFPGIKDVSGNLFVCGPNGTGKTHFMAALSYRVMWEAMQGTNAHEDEWMNRIRWVDAADIYMELREAYSKNAKTTERQIAKRFTEQYDTLFIDDLFAEKVTDYTLPTICMILRQREQYNRRTVITSNETVDAVAGVDKRIHSLLAGYRVIELKGQDRRKGRQH